MKHFQTEAFKPSSQSLDWIPYGINQELLFSNSKGEKIKLLLFENNKISESLKSQFNTPCPNDSLQTSYVDYTTFEYKNKFLVLEGNTSLLSIHPHVDVILDEKNSTLDDAKLSDIIKIDFTIKNSTFDSTIFLVLQFPVLDRGFTDALIGGYLYYPSILLNNKYYSEVYSNYENNEQIRVYYSLLGLLAFEIKGELFIRIN